MVSNSSGFQTLGLVSQGDITSSASGTAFTFAGINEVALIALAGSIDLSGISFANFHQLFIYARGSSGDVTMAAPISNIDKVRIRGERDVQLNATATVKFAGFWLIGTVPAGTSRHEVAAVKSTPVCVPNALGTAVGATKPPVVVAAIECRPRLTAIARRGRRWMVGVLGPHSAAR